jgi:hypothetical protein
MRIYAVPTLTHHESLASITATHVSPFLFTPTPEPEPEPKDPKFPPHPPIGGGGWPGGLVPPFKKM